MLSYVIQFMAGKFSHVPLDNQVLVQEENWCFDELYFGVSIPLFWPSTYYPI